MTILYYIITFNSIEDQQYFARAVHSILRVTFNSIEDQR